MGAVTGSIRIARPAGIEIATMATANRVARRDSKENGCKHLLEKQSQQESNRLLTTSRHFRSNLWRLELGSLPGLKIET
jgi:hypothetical protein